jgi:transcriptional regulator with XRE-family HTH domain
MEPSLIQALPNDLTALRRDKGISLAQIAQATKISLRYLEAIENGAFHKLPGGVYTLSYVRQYAQAIGDYDDALVDYYRKTAMESEPPVNESVDTPPWMDRVREYLWSCLGDIERGAMPRLVKGVIPAVRTRRS